MIRKLLPKSVRKRAWTLYMERVRRYARKSYSQEGEDMVLRRIFEGQRSGFFVDVGAHHPTRFSNTFFFYSLGWRGINIEPNPVGFALLQAQRPADTNVQCGISDAPGTLDYYMFSEPALNTFDAETAEQHKSIATLARVEQIAVRRLDEVLAEKLPAGQAVDFFTVDVEGHDLQVLQSNNWDAVRPKIVIAEALGTDVAKVQASEMAQFMDSVGYDFYAKTVNSSFFRRREES